MEENKFDTYEVDLIKVWCVKNDRRRYRYQQ